MSKSPNDVKTLRHLDVKRFRRIISPNHQKSKSPKDITHPSIRP
ncbi:MAG: hypothetical protein RLZZ198_2265, partial [Bacteroidota bacterium]